MFSRLENDGYTESLLIFQGKNSGRKRAFEKTKIKKKQSTRTVPEKKTRKKNNALSEEKNMRKRV